MSPTSFYFDDDNNNNELIFMTSEFIQFMHIS
jgi:hypothetical protein